MTHQSRRLILDPRTKLLLLLLVYGLPWLRSQPLKAARWLAKLATEYRLLAVGYVLGLFFVLPSAMLLASLWLLPVS